MSPFSAANAPFDLNFALWLRAGLGLVQNIVGLLEKWKKTGGLPAAGVVTNVVRNPADGSWIEKGNRNINRIARQVWEEERMTAKPSIYGQDPTEENALVRNDEDLMTSEKIHALVQESRKGFRVQEYGYTIGLGAYAKADAWQL